MSNPAAPRPPAPPSMGRSLRPAVSQLVGVSVLLLIVVAALAGVFGARAARTTAEAGALRLEVTYPTRFRYKTIDAVAVEVTNTSGADLDTIVVRFDREYVESFSTVSFTPSIARVTEEAYEVDLVDVRAGRTRPVSVEVQAEDYWRHAGRVEATTPEDSVGVDLATFVFP